MEPVDGNSDIELVKIRVNDAPVSARRRSTGLEIKVAAIEARVPIQLDFILSRELEHGRTKIVTNEETITLHDGESFVAVAPDDNS